MAFSLHSLARRLEHHFCHAFVRKKSASNVDCERKPFDGLNVCGGRFDSVGRDVSFNNVTADESEQQWVIWR